MKSRFITKKMADSLIEEYGSPLYVYSEKILREMSSKVADFLKGSNINYKCHYAVKANSNPHLLKIMREEGLFVDSMSPMELALVEASGNVSDEILYVCNNVSADEMKLVSDKGIRIVLDSVSQVETFGRICLGKEIIVRINPGNYGIGHSGGVITAGEKTKFGISKEDFSLLFSVVEKYNLKIVGLHQHLGSLFLNDKIDEYIAGVKALLSIAKEFKDLKIIDLGGGFGISYLPDNNELDLDLLKSKLVPVLEYFVNDYGEVEFKFEPGRIVVAESSVIIGTVMAVKNNGKITYIGTDIGMGTLERPSRYGSYHHIEILSDNKEMVEATIAGNICESCDVLGEDRKVILPNISDSVVVYDTGAYGFSMASSYTGRLRPAEVLIKEDGSATLIRKRETIDDVMNLVV